MMNIFCTEQQKELLTSGQLEAISKIASENKHLTRHSFLYRFKKEIGVPLGSRLKGGMLDILYSIYQQARWDSA
jgi:hypothetical protein